MPELPEVEMFRRFVERHALHKAIRHTHVYREKILESTSPEAFISATTGHSIITTERRGKHLLLGLSQKGKSEASCWVLMHFGMTGCLSYRKGDFYDIVAYGTVSRKPEHVRVRFEFGENQWLDFHEQRMFGKVGLVESPAAYWKKKKLGPDALAMPFKDFNAALSKRKGQIKPALLDQSLVAGVGNVYADELLFQCGVHPMQQVSELSRKEIQCLHAQMVDVLQRTVEADGDRTQLPDTYMIHLREKTGRCPRDGEVFAIETVGGRTTYFCPRCQQL